MALLRRECDANVRAAERVAGRCVEKAERFDETRSAFATVLGALDAAVAGAFSRAGSPAGRARRRSGFRRASTSRARAPDAAP